MPLLKHIVDKTSEYTRINNKSSRKSKGQFFTPLSVAQFMAKYAAVQTEHLSVLEPGAGNGILSAALVSYCMENNLCNSFSIDFVENDTDILPVLRETQEILERYVRNKHGNITIHIHSCNYLTDGTDGLYDIVICNPPYLKIRKDSDEAKCMAKYVHGQPNLYSLFMCKAITNLKNDGRFVFITPRSWTSGSYYRLARRFVLDSLSITDLILFQDRDNVFCGEDVLQETLITIGTKQKPQAEYINIYHAGSVDHEVVPAQIPYSLIKGIGKDNYLLIPSDEHDLEVIRIMSIKTDTFESLGYCFKTGPVVEFRNKEALSIEKRDGYVPMFRSANIVNGHFVFPASTKKVQYIDETAKNLMLPDMNTVFLRRLSAKEETRRLQSCVYYAGNQNRHISAENHVNYLVRSDGTSLTKEEVEWIHGLLMSDEYETYYRLINGSTQVNASEINQLPLEKRV